MAFPSFGCDVDDLVRPSAAFVPVVCDPNTKRHAAYFPADFDLDAQMRMCALEEEDDASSFLFRAPRVSKRSKKRPQSIAVMEVTPAQEIANRYRAGLKVGKMIQGLLALLLWSKAILLMNPGLEMRMRPLVSPHLSQYPTSAFRQSRVDILKDLREEALGEMRRLGVDEEHPTRPLLATSTCTISVKTKSPDPLNATNVDSASTHGTSLKLTPAPLIANQLPLVPYTLPSALSYPKLHP
ncbi:hypothetical protein VNI00_013571 [Paramarasmius palmivorus]|uniref:Uncharacterized protein n=1 Tax=Paramarasmius palmivorus TaxID=297713 RepID=A0AAW0BVM2_9AGAR